MTRYYALPSFSYKKISVYFFFKNLMAVHGNALTYFSKNGAPVSPIWTYFSKNVR